MPNPLTQVVEAKHITLKPLLDERTRRLWAAVEARSLGRGGIIRESPRPPGRGTGHHPFGLGRNR